MTDRTAVFNVDLLYMTLFVAYRVRHPQYHQPQDRKGSPSPNISLCRSGLFQNPDNIQKDVGSLSIGTLQIRTALATQRCIS